MDSGLLPHSLPIPSTSTKLHKVGDDVELCCRSTNHQFVQKRTEISAISPLVIDEEETPSWRITNTETYDLLDCPDTEGGALIDPADNSLVAFWMEYKMGKSMLAQE